MSVRCACCTGRLEIVRTERTDTRQHGVVEIEHWRCKADCRGGGHVVTPVDGDVVLHSAGPIFDYDPRPAAEVGR